MAKMLNFDKFCDTLVNDGDFITGSVEIFTMCEDFDAPGALLTRINQDVQSERGITLKETPEYIQLKNNRSTSVSSNVFSARPIELTVSVQTGAFNKIYDEINYGTKYEDDLANDGYETMLKGDRAGILAPRYSVILYQDIGQNNVKQTFYPKCEVMIQSETAMVVSTVYSIELMIKPLLFDGYNRAVVSRKKGIL